jgi:hypothetical protein
MKSEGRHPKSETSPNSEGRNAMVVPSAVRISAIGFFSDLGFRASDLPTGQWQAL